MKQIRILLFICCACLTSGILHGQIDESKRYNEEAIAEETRFVTASQLQILARYDEAITAFEKILKEDGEKAIVHFQLSRCHEATKTYDKAIKHALEAVKMDGNNEYFALQLAECYEADQQFSAAAKTFFNYTKAHPDNLFFYKRAVYFYLQGQEYDQAIVVLNKMEKQFGIQEDVSRQKFEIYSKSGNSKKATKALQDLTKAFPSKEKYKLNLANYYLQLGQMSKAKDIFKNILKTDPKNETALRYMELSNAPASNDEINYLNAIAADIPNMSITLDQKISKLVPTLKSLVQQPNKELNLAFIDITEELCMAYPESAEPKALKGDALMQAERYDEAVETYQSTLEINGSVFDVWYQLMVAQQKTERYKDLLKTSDLALLRFPNQAISYFFYGYALNRNNDPSEGSEIIQEGLLLSKNDIAVTNSLQIELARSQFLLNNYKAALSILTENNLEQASALELKGDIAFQQNDTEAALKYWEMALEKDPNNTNLSKKISQKQL